MILYEVLWDNGECYEDHMTSSLIFSTLQKAKDYYNSVITAEGYSYGQETLTINSFAPDEIDQSRTILERKVLLETNPFLNDNEEEEDWSGVEIGDLEDAMG